MRDCACLLLGMCHHVDGGDSDRELLSRCTPAGGTTRRDQRARYTNLYNFHTRMRLPARTITSGCFEQRTNTRSHLSFKSERPRLNLPLSYQPVCLTTLARPTRQGHVMYSAVSTVIDSCRQLDPVSRPRTHHPMVHARLSLSLSPSLSPSLSLLAICYRRSGGAVSTSDMGRVLLIAGVAALLSH